MASVQKKNFTGGFGTSLKVKNPEFYNLLFKWRSDKSIETGLTESRILRQKTVADIADILPPTVP